MSGFGFGYGGQSSDRQKTTSGGGQVVGLPSRRGLHACAGGVTGASPHIVIRNNGNNNINLFIIDNSD